MGKHGPQYTFNVNKALEMRVLGWTYSAIARHFHKDHTTIMYHCLKWGIKPFQTPPPVPEITFEDQESYKKKKSPPLQQKEYKYQYLFDQDGPINEGKPYQEYLQDAKKQQSGGAGYYLIIERESKLRFSITRPSDREKEERTRDIAGRASMVQGQL